MKGSATHAQSRESQAGESLQWKGESFFFLSRATRRWYFAHAAVHMLKGCISVVSLGATVDAGQPARGLRNGANQMSVMPVMPVMLRNVLRGRPVNGP